MQLRTSPQMRIHLMNIWGGGHTAQTDPSNLGWKARAQRGAPELIVIGRPGILGCASVRVLSSQLDIAIYDNLNPLALSTRLSAGRVPADEYFQTRPTPGWGLQVIRKLAEADNPQYPQEGR
jgi:hypothetical protein